MTFGTLQRLSNSVFPVVSHRGNEVGMVDTSKYLGGQLDSYLKFDKHVDYIKPILYIRMRTLGRIKQYIPNDLALQLYRSLILPHLDYGHIIYISLSACIANQL